MPKVKFPDLPDELQPPDEVWDEVDEQFEVYVLTQGDTPDGEPFWAYLGVPPSRIMDLKEASIDENFALMDYGRILMMGYGEEPPEEAQKQMEEEYGMQHNFEEEVQRVAEEMMKKQEVMDKYTKTKDPASASGDETPSDIVFDEDKSDDNQDKC